MKVKASSLSQTLRLSLFEAHGIPLPVPEFRFCEGRKWAFDWAWPQQRRSAEGYITNSRIALEIEGGVWTKGRHVRGTGFLKDMEKYNEAAILGWRVIRCTPADFNNGKVFTLIRRALGLPERSP